VQSPAATVRACSFVVIMGTDTMSYTASALSFMLENLSKTVVMTGELRRCVLASSHLVLRWPTDG
jgi:L-asparaginase/Glu-tRNA(Gln) amidotransferase subunit D